MNPTPPIAKPAAPAHPKGSITGFILSILALISSAIGTGLVHAHFKPAQTTGSKAGDAIASGTGHVISSIIALPFLIVGIILAVVATIFVLARLGKHLKVGGLVFSAVSLLLAIWSFSLVIDAFSLLKAH